MTIPQKELAELAGVSQKTVSLALRDQPGVSDHTRQRVHQLAEQLGYRPNAAARTTRTGKFGSIALLLGARAGHSSLPAAMLSGIQDGLATAGLNLSLVRLSDAELTQPDRLPGVLRETSSDGLLIDYTHDIPRQLVDLVRQQDLPAVWLNIKQARRCVHPDDFGGAVALTGHLLDLGHRRIAYLDSTSDLYVRNGHYSSDDRRAGYEQTLTQAGLTPRTLRVRTYEAQPGPVRHAQATALLRSEDRPTALICYGDTEMQTYAYVAASLGLRIPDDLSLAVYSPTARAWLGRAHTTMVLPEHGVGRAGVRMLLDHIDHPRRRQNRLAIPMTLEPGQTAGPPPADAT